MIDTFVCGECLSWPHNGEISGLLPNDNVVFGFVNVRTILRIPTMLFKFSKSP